MSNIYQIEGKKLEARYGPAIAQYICDELEKSERLAQKNKEQRLIKGFGENTIIYKAA